MNGLQSKPRGTASDCGEPKRGKEVDDNWLQRQFRRRLALTRAGAQSIRRAFIGLSWMFCASLLFWACLFFMPRRARWIFITRLDIRTG